MIHAVKKSKSAMNKLFSYIFVNYFTNKELILTIFYSS